MGDVGGTSIQDMFAENQHRQVSFSKHFLSALYIEGPKTGTEEQKS